MSYGFAADVMPNEVPNPNVPRGSHDSSFDATAKSHQIGWALSRGDSVHSSVDEAAIVSQDEIPCEAIFVPEDEMPIYSNWSVSKNFCGFFSITHYYVNKMFLRNFHIILCSKLLRYVYKESF